MCFKVCSSICADGAPSAASGAAPGVPPSWEPFYCVLQQDRRTLTAYTSEELAVSLTFVMLYKVDCGIACSPSANKFFVLREQIGPIE